MLVTLYNLKGREIPCVANAIRFTITSSLVTQCAIDELIQYIRGQEIPCEVNGILFTIKSSLVTQCAIGELIQYIRGQKIPCEVNASELVFRARKKNRSCITFIKPHT